MEINVRKKKFLCSDDRNDSRAAINKSNFYLMLQLGKGEGKTRNLGLIELNFSPMLRPSFEFHLKNLFPLKIVLKKILLESSMGFVGRFCD